MSFVRREHLPVISLRQRPRRRGGARGGACISAGPLDDHPRLRFRKPLDRDGVRVDLVPDMKMSRRHRAR